MKSYLSRLSVLAAASLLVVSCRKESMNSTDQPLPEPAMVLYTPPDTSNPVPGHYFITFKESFLQPFARIYTGDKVTRGAKEVPADAYARDAQAAMLDAIRNPDGSLIVPQASIHDFVSNVVVGFDAELTADAVKKLVAHPAIKYVEFQTEEFTDDDLPSKYDRIEGIDPNVQYVDPLRLAVGSKNGYTPSLTNTIWVVDGGCDMSHPDLRPYAPWAKSFSDQLTMNDVNGHGTKVAGVIAAIDNAFGTKGVAAGAYFVPVKITNANGKSSPSNFVKALDYIWYKSINDDVVNISQSFSIGTVGVGALEEAIKSYIPYEVWFSVSAGNDKTFASQRSPARMCSPNYPYSETLKFMTCVSSYGTSYKFSKVFPNPAYGSNYGVAVDYASAGEGIYTTAKGGGYEEQCAGTSYSAPVVAGILFLNKGVIYNNKTPKTVSGDVDSAPDKIAALNYQF